MSHNYLRRYRMRGMFTQSELADLLGVYCRLKVVRFERLQFLPKLETALAYQIIFDVPVHEMFPGLYENVGKEVLERALQLSQQLKADTDNQHTQCKIHVLNDIIQRMEQRRTDQK